VAKRTLLYDLHLKSGGRIVDFHGWLLPVQYEGILAEATHTRAAASLFDTCHMGQFLLYGPTAAADLASMLTHDARTLPIGKCRYGLILNLHGGILDDCIVLRLGQREFLLVVNAGTSDSDYDWLSSHLSGTTTIVNQSQSWGKIDLQGPLAFELLNKRVDEDLSALKYFNGSWARCCGRDCIISRTGYTGELGYEIFAPGWDVVAIAESLLSEEAVKWAGLGARDLLRLEMCYPLYGQDMDRETNPIEADAGYFVKLDHEFTGWASVKKAMEQGPRRKLVAFKADTRRRANTGDAIYDGQQEVGQVTSGAFSPHLGASIGMGYVATELAEPGRELIVRTARAEIPITLAAKPLYSEGTCRRKL
jgi:aminomethyltransferase